MNVGSEPQVLRSVSFRKSLVSRHQSAHPAKTELMWRLVFPPQDPLFDFDCYMLPLPPQTRASRLIFVILKCNKSQRWKKDVNISLEFAVLFSKIHK